MSSMSRNPITFECVVWVECSLNPPRWHPHELGDLIQWHEEQFREFSQFLPMVADVFDGVADRQGQVSILLQPGGSVCMILQMSR